MPISLLCGLGAAVAWGSADFIAGLQARQLPALVVAFWSQVAGALVLAVLLLIGGQPPVPAGLLWGLVAGLSQGIASACLYRGLSAGAMSIVAPISACGVIVPVLVALARGEIPGPVVALGMATAVVGIVLASRVSEHNPHPSGKPGLVLALALTAALGIGVNYVLVHEGTQAGASPLWVAAAVRMGSVPTLLVLLLVSRPSVRWPAGRLAPVAAAGLLDMTANTLFAYAASLGQLAIASVVSSLYPVATVVLARVSLAERLSGSQRAGVTLALLGVVLISAG